MPAASSTSLKLPPEPTGLHQEQLRIPAEAGDAVAVRDRAGCERGDECPMAVPVDDVGPAVDEVPGLGVLRRNVRMRDVDSRIDDGDLDRARGSKDLFGHLVEARRDVLPLVGNPRPEDDGECRLHLARADEGPV